MALLLASFLTPPLIAQRAGAGFRGFAPNGHSGHITPRGFSNGHFEGRFHRHDGLGAFWSPYFLPDDQSYWWGNSGPEPLAADSFPRVLYAPPEQERPPADPQLIELPAAAHESSAKPAAPAVFVLIGGERLETQRFVLTVHSLSVDIDRRERVIPLQTLDLGATTAANHERGVDLRIPDDRNQISLSF
ncbi:MAG TPA: hypothetical protein VMU05_05080 [Dongiaceae bacterium]|nr:hypothetical protein [Dongiaceae bacterium]